MNKIGISSGITPGLGGSTGDNHSGDHIGHISGGTSGLGDKSDISSNTGGASAIDSTIGDITADKK